MENDDEIVKPKVQPYKSKRFFLSSLNSYLGQQLVAILRNEQQHPQDPNLIIGTTIINSKYPVPEGVRKIIDPLKLSFLEKAILDSDIIIYDINTCDHSEAEYAIKALKLGEYEQEKILILISSVLAWSATDPKEKKAGDEEDEGQLPESEEEQADKPKEEENEDAPPKKEYVRFTEADFPKRRPLPQFEALRSLESMCLSLNKKNLKPFILCSGLLYGMGEIQFYDHFRTAWLQQTINYYGNGKNRLPCIHVKDLALFVAKVVEKQPNQRYIFAIDHNQNPQQKKLIESISKGVGNGKIESIDTENEIFTMDLRMKPTKAFDQFLEEAAQQEEPEEGQVSDKYTFNWWCKEGLRANIAKIREEFLEFHKLKSIKIFITGPPASGKSKIAQELSEYFKIPQISIKQLIEQYLNQNNNEEVENLKGALEDSRRTLIEEAQAQYDVLRKKRKTLGLPYIAFDESKIEAKLNDEQLIVIYKWRLNQNDCQNRGFILDGFPKSYPQAKQLFFNIEGEGEEQKITLNKLILPNHIIRLQGSDDDILNRIQMLKDNLYDEDQLQKRLKNYRNLNLIKGHPILIDFFVEQKLDICNIQVFNKQSKILDATRSFVERFGKYENYDRFEQEREQERLLEKKRQLAKQEENKLDQQEQRDLKEKSLWKIQEEEYKIKQQHSVNYERELLDSKSLPLRFQYVFNKFRQYLNDNVVPFITEGLIEVVKSNSQNPVEYLAEFLFKRSLQVKFPDPKKYFEKADD